MQLYLLKVSKYVYNKIINTYKKKNGLQIKNKSIIFTFAN